MATCMEPPDKSTTMPACVLRSGLRLSLFFAFQKVFTPAIAIASGKHDSYEKRLGSRNSETDLNLEILL